MGFLQKMFGSVDTALVENGVLARGEITGLELSGMTMQVGNGLVERKVTFQLMVYLDLQPAYAATSTQRVQEIAIPQLSQGGVVAVRVDPNDHSHVQVDFQSEVPVVRLPKPADSSHSAAYVLEHGTPIEVVLTASNPLGVNNWEGNPVYRLALTVAKGVDTPYQIEVGNSVPASALPLLFPGSKLHAKLGDGPNDVAVDWAAGAAS